MFRFLKKLFGPTERKAISQIEKGMKQATKDFDSTTGKSKPIFKSYEEQKRIAEKKKDKQHRNAEQQYNEHFDGCPACSKPGLTIQWIIVGENQKAKSIECEYCNTLFEENVVEGELELTDVNSIYDIPPVRSAMNYEKSKHKKLGNL